MAIETQELVQYLPHLRRFAWSLTHRAAEADDLVQDCLERAVGRIEQFQPGTNLRAWLFKIMHSIFVNGCRRRARRGTEVEYLEWRDGPPCAPVQERRLEIRDFRRVLMKLPRDSQVILMLVGAQGASYQEAAQILKLPIGTIRSRLSRARETLRKLLDPSVETAVADRTAKKVGRRASMPVAAYA
ncbi:sigma-70 family RNA polymerase sigma factor [Oceanibacterium hippocampi]|uniref:ECF RNA polymerase sigma factor SigR n=1 Tax=Oceanibacterium hippocampi TaxID=745714 RepID=A0A1Y5TLS3_9PROT|nr:sigma-70 family RNA polymerase sigma factor [Oceanibacterium hippocampi]SLN67025.1 ECF RNA polymerase sigma factor SigR [Oceanibacterium hippocampi]